MHSYSLKFTKNSKKEWDKLDYAIKLQMQKKLKKRLQNPKILSDKLSGYENIYKIKLKNAGFRLAYEVQDEIVVVLVLKIGKHDKFYDTLQKYT